MTEIFNVLITVGAFAAGLLVAKTTRDYRENHAWCREAIYICGIAALYWTWLTSSVIFFYIAFVIIFIMYLYPPPKEE